MKRTIPLILILFAVVLAGLGALNRAVLALSFPLLLYLAAGLYLAPETLDLHASRHIKRDRGIQGGPVTIRVEVTNHGSHLNQVILQDPLPEGLELVEGSNQRLTTLEPGQTVVLTYTAHAARGIFRFDAVQAAVKDPLWITDLRRSLPAPGQVVIQPTVEELDRIPIQPRNTRVYAGYIPSRQGGTGVDFFGVRQYQPGDPLRWINWKASARFQHTLFINQYEQQRITDVGLILDTRVRSEVRTRDGASLFEHSVDAAASLAGRFLDDGNRVGLLMYGTQLDWTLPGYSKIQKERIQNSLARAELGESLVFDKLENIPTRLLPPKSQVVLISPLQSDDLSTLINLRAHGYAILVLSPDPIAFEERHLKGDDTAARAARFAHLERQSLLQNLRQAGIQVVNWQVENSLQAALHRAYLRPVRSVRIRGVLR